MYIEKNSPKLALLNTSNDDLIINDKLDQLVSKFSYDSDHSKLNANVSKVTDGLVSLISNSKGLALADNSSNSTDISGVPRPSPGMVIGPTGHWQMSIGAETELLYGSSASLENASAPTNTPACEEQCIGISVGWSLYSGDNTSEQIENASDVLKSSSNEGMKAAGHVIKRYAIPYKIYETGTQLPNIEKECGNLCNMSPIDYQLEHGLNK